MFIKFLINLRNLKNLKFLNYKYNKFLYKNLYFYYNFYIIYFYIYKNVFYFYFFNIRNTNLLLNNVKKIQKKNLILFFNIFYQLYNLFYNNKNFLKILNFKYLNEFLYNFFKYNNFNNIIFIINWILNLIKPLFFLQCSIIPKKYIKKLKKKFIYKIKYLSCKYRISKSLKLIQNYINNLNYIYLTNRLLFCYLDLCLNYKISYIYLKKILIYKKVFKI